MKNRKAWLLTLLLALAMTFEAGALSREREAEPAPETPPSTAVTDGARYRIDAAQSRFTVRVFVGGLLSGFGHDHTIAARNFSGETQFTYGTVAPASLQMTVRAASLSVTDKVSQSDREKIEATMRDEVLEVAKYPEINFRSTNVTASRVDEGVYQVQISGELTLHGVTRGVVINTRASFGAGGLRAQGEFSIKHADYNLKRVSVAGGTIKVKEEIKLSFDILAH
ncbi:MAG TPA: YceI family protein [Blastocatellia bacterium]|nr:YceI family protein [Blastocatellia bacterium]